MQHNNQVNTVQYAQKLYRLKVRRSLCLQPLIDIRWIQRTFVLKPKLNKMLVAVISFHLLDSLAVVWEVAVSYDFNTCTFAH